MLVWSLRLLVQTGLEGHLREIEISRAGFMKRLYRIREPMQMLDKDCTTQINCRKHRERCEQLQVTTKILRLENLCTKVHTVRVLCETGPMLLQTATTKQYTLCRVHCNVFTPARKKLSVTVIPHKMLKV